MNTPKELPLKINDEKNALRSFFKEKRKSISKDRRQYAAVELFEKTYPILIEYEYVLSFASLPEELDTKLLNQKLCEEKRLVLPKLIDDEIHLYEVHDLSKLEKSRFNILEPSHKGKKRLEPKSIGCALIPGLGFDSAFHRLGYGKGHYDTFLATTPKTYKIGIGFKEQLAEDLFPLYKHDVKLDDVMLF